MTEPQLPYDSEFGGYVEAGPGWFPLIVRLHESLLAIDAEYTVAQVKEKYGGLRYYADFTVTGDEYERARELIRTAEEESYRVCEDCGRPGELEKSAPWLRTVCIEHRSTPEDQARGADA